jgi:hypothetical protein
MSTTKENKAPTWFMVVASVLFAWNLLGVMAYLVEVTMDPVVIANLGNAQLQLDITKPVWATAAFAIAVNGGALGCLLLLLKRNLAGLFLQVSLAGVLVHEFFTFFISEFSEVFSPGNLVMPVMVLVIAVYLVILAAKAKANHWTV